MISIETRKFILKLILVCLYTDHTYGCASNKQLYTEIGCKPIYSNSSAPSSCPTAYNCENVFTRSSDKCYFNGNVYEPLTRLSDTDSKLSPCLASCFCHQSTTHDNNTITKFTCAQVECPSYFNAGDIMGSCYYQYEKDSCCEINKYCPEEKSIVHECIHDGKTYKNGQRFYIGDYLQCVCSPEFNGTASDKSCRKIGCNYEILYMKNILRRSAPIYFENTDGCPIDWYHFEHDVITAETTSTDSKSSGNLHQCKYGDLSFAIGQKLAILGQQSDSNSYESTCSCNVPPLLTCVKVRRKTPESNLNITKID